jgi:hypothetical protein
MYPRKKFAPMGGYVIAEDAAHERALGPNWLDNEPQPILDPLPPDSEEPILDPLPPAAAARKARR